VEHLLLIAGCLLIISRRPALGFFIFGLALWNKAVFVWALSGLAAAVAVAYLPELRRFLGDRRVIARSAIAFLAGALPLDRLQRPRSQRHHEGQRPPSVDNFRAKAISLRITLDGSALWGVIVQPDWAENPKSPQSFHGRVLALDSKTYRPASLQSVRLRPHFFMLSAPLWWRSPGRRAASSRSCS